MDLSIIYTVVFACRDEESGSITINHGHMKLWGVTEQELFEQVKSNMDAAGKMEIMGIAEILRRAAGDETAKEIGIAGCGAWMYVVSSRNRLHGAAAMISRKTMREAAETIGGDFMILPSSVHELVLVPSTGKPGEAVQMARMVREINKTEVAEDEILSCHVYRYDCRTGNISVAA